MGKFKTKEDFIICAKKIHGDKYDYSKVEYVNRTTKVCIVCPIHGEFWQTPHKHLQGQGCSKCSHKNRKSVRDLTSFISNANKIHNNKYDYSKVKYVNSQTKVCIVCPIHGEFWQRPADHIRGMGCIYCSGRYQSTTEQFIEKAKKIHGDKYDYSKVKYINAHTPINLVCMCKKRNGEIHGDFFIKPNNLLNKHGCPLCRKSKLEIDVENELNFLGIKYEYQKRFNWLFFKYPQSLDFYLPEYNIAIECQGDTHFSHFTDTFSISSNLINKDLIVERDINKSKLCKNSGIKLFYIVPEFFMNYLDKEIYQGIYNDDNIILYKNLRKWFKHLLN